MYDGGGDATRYISRDGGVEELHGDPTYVSSSILWFSVYIYCN